MSAENEGNNMKNKLFKNEKQIYNYFIVLQLNLFNFILNLSLNFNYSFKSNFNFNFMKKIRNRTYQCKNDENQVRTECPDTKSEARSEHQK